MKLTRIIIENLRAIEYLDLTVGDFMSLIGPNNAGKSSILRAIVILLNQEKPEPSEWRQGHEEEPIRITGVFEDIQEWERNKPGVSGLINDGKVTLRATAFINEGSVSLEYDAYIRPADITGWADRWWDLGDEVREAAVSLGINGHGWRSGANRERVREAIAQRSPEMIAYGEPEWTSENISIAPALKQAVPQAVLVPAVRDASDDLKPAARTSFGLLLKKILLPAIQESDEYKELLTAVGAFSDRLRATGGNQLEAVSRLAEELSQRMSTIIEANVRFQLDTPDTEKFVGANTRLSIDDGTETPTHLQGHGAQRALVFAMIEVLARHEAFGEDAENRSTLLLFEEPEIFLHPHLMRRLKQSLTEISTREDWQVVLTTHSPFFVNVADDPISLVILSRPQPGGPVCSRQLTGDPFVNRDGEYDERQALRAALDFHPTVADAFFAKRVVLVEGDTELAVLRHSSGIQERMGIERLDYDLVTIVSCGGKWTIPAMARVLRAFGIPFRVIHDEDRKGRSDQQLEEASAIDPYRANDRIAEVAGGTDVYIVRDTFEDLLWPCGNSPHSDKPFRAWQRIQALISGDIEIDQMPELEGLFRFSYSQHVPEASLEAFSGVAPSKE